MKYDLVNTFTSTLLSREKILPRTNEDVSVKVVSRVAVMVSVRLGGPR